MASDPLTPPSPADEPATSSTSSDPVGTPGDSTPPAPRQDAPKSPAKDPLRGSRTSGAWIFAVLLGVVLVLLIIFIAQNTQKVEVTFLGWNGRTPLAVALMVAAAGGIFLTAIAGSMRILQLRRRVKKDAKAGRAAR